MCSPVNRRTVKPLHINIGALTPPIKDKTYNINVKKKKMFLFVSELLKNVFFSNNKRLKKKSNSKYNISVMYIFFYNNYYNV